MVLEGYVGYSAAVMRCDDSHIVHRRIYRFMRSDTGYDDLPFILFDTYYSIYSSRDMGYMIACAAYGAYYAYYTRYGAWSIKYKFSF